MSLPYQKLPLRPSKIGNTFEYSNGLTPKFGGSGLNYNEKLINLLLKILTVGNHMGVCSAKWRAIMILTFPSKYSSKVF